MSLSIDSYGRANSYFKFKINMGMRKEKEKKIPDNYQLAPCPEELN